MHFLAVKGLFIFISSIVGVSGGYVLFPSGLDANYQGDSPLIQRVSNASYGVIMGDDHGEFDVNSEQDEVNSGGETGSIEGKKNLNDGGLLNSDVGGNANVAATSRGPLGESTTLTPYQGNRGNSTSPMDNSTSQGEFRGGNLRIANDGKGDITESNTLSGEKSSTSAPNMGEVKAGQGDEIKSPNGEKPTQETSRTENKSGELKKDEDVNIPIETQDSITNTNESRGESSPSEGKINRAHVSSADLPIPEAQIQDPVNQVLDKKTPGKDQPDKGMKNNLLTVGEKSSQPQLAEETTKGVKIQAQKPTAPGIKKTTQTKHKGNGRSGSGVSDLVKNLFNNGPNIASGQGRNGYTTVRAINRYHTFRP